MFNTLQISFAEPETKFEWALAHAPFKISSNMENFGLFGTRIQKDFKSCRFLEQWYKMASIVELLGFTYKELTYNKTLNVPNFLLLWNYDTKYR